MSRTTVHPLSSKSVPKILYDVILRLVDRYTVETDQMYFRSFRSVNNGFLETMV